MNIEQIQLLNGPTKMKNVFTIFAILCLTVCAKAQTVDPAWLKNAQTTKGEHLVPFKEKQAEKIYLRVHSVNPPTDRLPPFDLVQGDYLQSGVMKYVSTMDVMDRDIFYVKLKREGKEKFLSMTRAKKIPDNNALKLYALIHRNHFYASIIIRNNNGVEVGYKHIQQLLTSISVEPTGYKFNAKNVVFRWNRISESF